MLVEKIQHVIQPTPNSCVPTCISMVTGVSLDKILEMTGNPEAFNRGWTPDQEVSILVQLGILPLYDTFNNYYHDSIYLVTVASLNLDRSNHRIILDLRDESNRIVYDPNEGREGKLFYSDVDYNQGRIPRSDVTRLYDVTKVRF